MDLSDIPNTFDEHEPYLLACGLVIDGTDGPPLEDCGLLIDGGRISEVAPLSEMGRRVRHIDLSNRVVMPGLVDAHAHLMYSMYKSGVDLDTAHSLERAALNAGVNASRVLRMGWTTVRDLGSRGGVMFAVRDAVEAGLIDGPRILASGPIISTTGGLADFHASWTGTHAGLGLLADGEEEIRKAVRRLVKDGADCIKVEASAHAFTRTGGSMLTTMSEPEIRAAVDEAHKYGRRVAAHAQTRESVLNALRAGVDTVEHATFLDDEGIDLFKTTGAFLVPTLSNLYSYIEEGPSLGISETVIEEMRELEGPWTASLRKAIDAGIPIVVGTDVGNRYQQEARSVELRVLVRHGLSPDQALRGATGLAARAIGMDGLVGTLAPGAHADLLILDENPIDNLEVLSDSSMFTVLKGGRRVQDRGPASQLAS